MGKQIRFFMVPEDVLDADRRIRARLDRVVLAGRSMSSQPLLVPDLRLVEQIGGGTLLYLARPQDVPLIRVTKVAGGRHWSIDSTRSPVIEVSLTPFDGKILREGRFFYETSFLNENRDWAEKPKEFSDWAAAIFRVLKKALMRVTLVFGESVYRDYIGHEADSWRKRVGAKYALNKGFIASEVLASTNGRMADCVYSEPEPPKTRQK